ncbi:MAG TPA: ornithine--oxo-acid transaminase, partial [Anaerolineales bacterium]|nr:ornithine--oxo-acid transaminase [Anaerolineales bacterium]
EKAEGVWVYDVDGRKYLDCLSSYSAVNQGHVHPEILNAMLEQAKRVTLTSRAFRNDQLPLLYKELSEMTGYEMSLPMNSGAEAVETAVKLARKWAYQVKGVPRHQAEIIVADGNFHGRTVTIISFSTEPSYRDDFGPFTPGFVVVKYGDAGAIEKAITPNTAAVMLEPIQGEAGVIVPPAGYLKKVAEICKRNNVLFMADEIQTGLARTGKLFASHHEDVRPDVVIVGKALSGGFYPVSAVLADKAILGLFNPGEHGSTFGGNPLGAAVARAALRVIREEKLAERSQKLGDYFMEQLAEIPSPHVKEVRGKGLLIGVELKPEAGGARRFCEALKSRGILAKETHDHVIRFAPPLVIDKETIDWALPSIRDVLNMK